jgi:imidazole glycerol phosphate synthase subunit HisF
MLAFRRGFSMYDAKLVQPKDRAALEAEIKSIDVSDVCVKIMREKATFRLVRLQGVRNAVANIIKQEMIAAGGDATVSQHTVGCEQPKTDALLMGTIAHYKKFLAKMRMQGAYLEEKQSEYRAISQYFRK